MAHGFGHQGQAGERAQVGHDMGRVTALPPTRLQQARANQGIEQEGQQPLFGTGRQQAGAKIPQDRGVKTGVIDVQRERIFPIQAGPDRLGGRSIAQLFDIGTNQTSTNVMVLFVLK